MVSWQARLARRAIRRLFNSADDAPIAEQRAELDRLARLPKLPTARRKEVQIGGVRCLQITPTRSITERHLVYFHGGAYVVGSPESHAAWVQMLGVRANAVVTLVDYSLAPENPYPAAIDDCVAVVRALQEDHAVSPDTMVLGGDSAGGGATLATLCRLRDAGDSLPAGAVLFSPWTDLTASGASMTTRAALDPMIDPTWIARYAAMYHGDTPADHPEVSPLFADLTGLPPTLIQVGDHEILLDDSVRLAEAMTAAGVSVELEIAPEMWHVYQAFGRSIPEARAALRRAAGFLDTCTRAAPRAA